MKQKLFTLLTLLCFTVSGAWADETTTWAHGFEDGTAWNGSNTSNRAANATAKRTGEKGMYATFSKGDGRLVKGGSVNYSNGNYYYAICWMKSTVAGTAGIGLAGAGGKDIAVSANTWTRIYKKFNPSGDGSGKNLQPTISSSSSGTLYVDDVVWYKATGNVEPDFTAPSPATAASATVAAISWANGSDTGDGATGIQNTLIFKRTSGSAEDLTLNSQGVYTGSDKDQSGHWTLVTASVSAAATSYSGSFTSGDVYAIVHRDLAYNYSTPTYVTIPASSGHTISFNANGGTGTMASIIEIEDDGNATLPSNTFTKTGYTFANWTADVNVTIGGSVVDAGEPISDEATITNINSDIALTAQWDAVDYVITHSDASNGTYTIKVGDEEAVNTDTQANYGQTITLAATPDDGYALSAWNVSETVSGNPVAVTENAFTMPAVAVTIAPTFAQVYTVTYNGNDNEDGSVPVDANSPYTSGSNVTVLGNTGSLTKTSYVFIGWNTAADGSGTSYAPGDKFSISANTTLYAQWGVSLTWNVQVNEEETTVTTTSTASSNASFIAAPTSLALTDLTVESSKKGTATNKISTTKDKGGYISATFAIQDGYRFIPKRMVLKTTAITEAKTVEVNVGDEVQTWSQPKSGADPDEHNYTFASAKAYVGTVTMKIYCYGGSDGTKGYRLGTPIVIYGEIETVSGPSDPVEEGETVTLTTSENMAGWRAFNPAGQGYTLDANTTAYIVTADASDGKIALQTLAGPEEDIPGNLCVLLNTTSSIDSHKMTLTKKTVADNDTYASTNKLKASTGALANVYRLGYGGDGVAFYPYSGTPAAGTVYLNVSSTEAHALTFDFGGGTTSIGDVLKAMNEKSANAVYFNLAGQRIAQPTKGLYIVNGKKVIVK